MDGRGIAHWIPSSGVLTTEHANMQGMPWSVGFATPKQSRLKNSWHEELRVVSMATNSEKSARYTGWHRTIQEFADELGGDSVEQPEGTV